MWNESDYPGTRVPAASGGLPDKGLPDHDSSNGLALTDICDLHMVRANPQQSLCLTRLGAILGWTIRTSAQWMPWKRLRDIYGWSILLTAAERCEEQRFPQTVERMCRAEKRSRDEYKRLSAEQEKLANAKAEEQAKLESAKSLENKYQHELAGLTGAARFYKLAEISKRERQA